MFVQPSEFWQNSMLVKTIVNVPATVFAQPSEFAQASLFVKASVF